MFESKIEVLESRIEGDKHLLSEAKEEKTADLPLNVIPSLMIV